MEELKNIRTFEEFKDSVNEELLWDAIKGLFSKIFGKIDKKLADAVANFTKKLDGAKSWEESVRYFEEALNVEKTDMKATLETVSGPLGLRKVIADNASISFIQLQELTNKYQIPNLAPKVVYAGQPEEEMFKFDKSEEFNNNVMQAANAKVIELNKANGAPYNEQELTTYLTANSKDMAIVQPVAAPGTPTIAEKPAEQKTEVKPTGKDAVNQNQQNTQFGDSFSYFGGVKLNEEADPAPTGTIPTGDVSKLKVAAETWVTENIYGYSLKKVKEVKPPAKIGAEDAVMNIAKGSRATKLPQNLAKLLKNIINIEDQAKLIQVRDAIAKIQGKNPDDFKKEMPL